MDIFSQLLVFISCLLLIMLDYVQSLAPCPGGLERNTDAFSSKCHDYCYNTNKLPLLVDTCFNAPANNRKCAQTQCGSQIYWKYLDDTVIPRKDCCRPGDEQETCSSDVVCDNKPCTAVPGARCSINKCGRCTVEWFVRDTFNDELINVTEQCGGQINRSTTSERETIAICPRPRWPKRRL